MGLDAGSIEKEGDLLIQVFTLQTNKFYRCLMLYNRCQSCDCKLWSNYAKTLGICPDCAEPDKPMQDLEDELESILDQQE